ncbi:MAG: type II toxin-antitoxin system VapC family toxin [Verrucomicrobiae bacterium]|nr:type II toxin-antitoxin system VapC family toxin [Verrucomicrobiae bacterium]MCP5540025.1 type II toxin-antitoxin system VapC family toxin [Akkermansiaceae bacterium]MCP5549960.1 type II toxin-antitoxin system VapC family toxin [Akkermansiaceae bacterium]
MAGEVFVDTSGWCALLDRRESRHERAREILRQLLAEGRTLVTSDYVIDETCTLTRARAGGDASVRFLRLIENTAALRIEWVGSERFAATKAFFVKHADQQYSFTDCASFLLMRESNISEALTSDSHFHSAGFVALLSDG